MKEKWKDIKGYEGLYQVSNLGRIKSLRGNSERILKPGANNKGYLYVRLYKNSKSKWFTLHRLVAEAFIPNPENKSQVNHIDEDKTNNVVSNLEWMTPKDNANHGTRTSRMIISKSIPIAAIKDETRLEFKSQKHCATELGLSAGCISECLSGKRKTHGGFKFEHI